MSIEIKISMLGKKIWQISYPKNYLINLYEYDLSNKTDKDEDGVACNHTIYYYQYEKIKNELNIYIKKGKLTHDGVDEIITVEKRKL